MAISDDESDLSDSLSSACSTVPLPSSELGSRAGSTHPPSPSIRDPSSSKSPAKPDRKPKGQVGRPKGSTNAALAIINDQDHQKKSCVISRSRASVGPSTTSDIDRPIKCGSLPPPSSVKHPRRSSLSSNVPRSAKGQSFDSKSVNNLSSDPFLKLTNSVQHPCTSHGRLPLFEQPVLLQGARPRRVVTSTTQKPPKPPKAPRTKNKRKNPNVTSDTLKPLPDNLSQKAQTYKDDESSLTEQSSSEEEVPSKSTTDGTSCIPTKRSPSPLISRPPEKVNPSVGSSQTTSQSINGTSESVRPNGSSRLHELDSIEPCPASSSSPSFNLVARCDNSLTRLDLPSDSVTTSLKVESLTPTDISPVLHDTLNIPTTVSSTPKLDPCKGKLKADRGISEESALTPEPDDGRHEKSNHLDIISEPVNLPTSIPAHIISAPSPPKNTLSTPLTSPTAESINPPLPSLPSRSSAQTVETTSSPSLHPQAIRPRTLSIIPTPFTDTKSGLSLPVLADQGPDTEPSSSTFAPSLLYQGWETGSSVPTPRLPDESSRQSGLPNAVASLADDALDGEPITDDLMDYEFQIKGSSNPGPISNNPSELLITEEAVDGVPLMDIDDQISISEEVKSTDMETQERLPTPPVTTVEPMVITESKPVITDDNPIVERASSPPSAPVQPPAPLVDTIYECDDHARRREEALQAMVKIEIRFAQLRDRLYVERMADVHRETDAIHQGSHPELNEYYEMLERKRSSRLSLANKVFSLKEVELSKRREAATNAVWNKWNEVKTDLRNKMIAETQCQLKQIERERSQPELRYNVEVQLLPKAIIPQAVRRKSRKRAKIEHNDGREEILALELRSAIAKRASINLSSLTPEESCMDLAHMKPQQPTYTSHLDPINILRPLPPPPSQASTSSTIHALPSQHQPQHHHQHHQHPHHPHHHHSLTSSTDHLPNSSSSTNPTSFGTLPISCSKTIPNQSEPTPTTSLLLNRYRPTMNHTRPSISTIPDSLTNSHQNQIGPMMMMSNGGIRKLDQRRPTLDAVMATTTTTTTTNHSFVNNSNGPNGTGGNGGNGASNSNNSNLCASASANRHNNLYPTLPIPVNYH